MRCACVFLFGMMAFCTEQNRILVHTAAVDDHTNPDVGQDIEFLHVPTEGYVAQKPGFYAVHDANDWLFIWKDPRHDDSLRPPRARLTSTRRCSSSPRARPKVRSSSK